MLSLHGSGHWRNTMNWSWLAAFGSIFGVLLTIVLWRRGRWTMLWGAAWGIAAGSWFLAPWFVRVHHIQPTSASEWAALFLYLICAFSLLGALLSLIGLPVIALSEKLAGRRLGSGDVGRCAATAAILPVLYIGFSIALEYINFGRFPPLPLFHVLLGPWMAAYLASITMLWWAGRRAAGDSDRPLRILHSCMVALVFLGLIALPYRIHAREDVGSPATESRVVRKTGHPTAAPLLIIGLDGGNWRPIQPMLDRKALPTFQHLLSSGMRGEVQALWAPYWSAPAWGAIYTGSSREEIGVYEDLTAKAPGLPLFDLPLEVNLAMNPLFGLEYLLISQGRITTMPPPRTVLRRTPFWELLTKAGAKTAVFRLHFTYPVGPDSGFVVSNRVGPDLFEMLNVEKPERGVFSPLERKADLMRGFDDAYPVSHRLIDEINPRREKVIPSDLTLDPTKVLGMAEEIDDRTLASALGFIESNPDVKVVAVHVVGFDNVSHAFSQYRFPEDYPHDPPSPEDVRRYGGVIERYLEFLDTRFGKLIASFPEPPNVIILSDHGHGPSETRTLWRDFHAATGLFVAAGPAVPPSAGSSKVSYYDILPTILDLAGFEKPQQLRGTTLMTINPGDVN